MILLETAPHSVVIRFFLHLVYRVSVIVPGNLGTLPTVPVVQAHKVGAFSGSF